MSTHHPDVPPEYAHLTPRDLLRLYAGEHAQPCPPELLGWLDCAIRLHDLILREEALHEALQ